MKNSILNKAIDDALEDALADLARSSTKTNPPEAVEEPEEREKTTGTSAGTSRNGSEHECVNRANVIFAESETGHNSVKLPGIIDHKVTLLAVAGAAVNADAEPCLDKIVHELEGTGVTKDDIREAVESGRFLGVRPDLAAKVFERNCDEADEQESLQKFRSNSAALAAAERN
jgi:hypothetical protein